MSQQIRVGHYSALDGWTVEFDLGQGATRLTIRGAFLLGVRLVRIAAIAWLHSVMAGER